MTQMKNSQEDKLHKSKWRGVVEINSLKCECFKIVAEKDLAYGRRNFNVRIESKLFAYLETEKDKE